MVGRVHLMRHASLDKLRDRYRSERNSRVASKLSLTLDLQLGDVSKLEAVASVVVSYDFRTRTRGRKECDESLHFSQGGRIKSFLKGAGYSQIYTLSLHDASN